MTGYRAELRAKKYLEDMGYNVIRSRGSHGLFDVVAFNKDVTRFIQIKKTKEKSIPAYIRERNVLADLAVSGSIRVEFWVWQERKGWQFFLIK